MAQQKTQALVLSFKEEDENEIKNAKNQRAEHSRHFNP